MWELWDGEPEKSENEERRLVAVLAFVNLIASPFRRHHHDPTIHHHRVSCIQTHWQADKKLCCLGSVKIEIAAITLLSSLLQIPEIVFQDFRILVSFSRFLKSGWLFQIAACSILIWPRSANALVGGAFDAIFKAALSTSTSLWRCFLFDKENVNLGISEKVLRRKNISGCLYHRAAVQRWLRQWNASSNWDLPIFRCSIVSHKAASFDVWEKVEK